jgi:hypothetical protein
MKKLFSGIMAAALLMGLAGCAALNAICNPTTAQQQTAANIENFISSGVVAVMDLVVQDDKGNNVVISQVDVNNMMNTIIAGGCAAVGTLTAILNWYQQITHPSSTVVKGKIKFGVAVPGAPDPTPLWNWMGKTNPYASQ